VSTAVTHALRLLISFVQPFSLCIQDPHTWNKMHYPADRGVLLGCYAAQIGSLLTFQDKQSVPSSRINDCVTNVDCRLLNSWRWDW